MVTKEELEAYLWTEADTRMESVLADVNAQMVKYVGDYSDGAKTITVDNFSVTSDVLPLHHINCVRLISINGEDFTEKANGTDYLIRSDGTVKVPGIASMISNRFGAFQVVYETSFDGESGFVIGNRPEIVGAVSDLVAFLYARDGGKEIQSETAWPRSVSYASKTEGSAYAEFRKRLKHLIPSHLLIW